MNNKIVLGIIIFVLLALDFGYLAQKFYIDPALANADVKTSALSHRQIVWINALEWCESRGNPAAINPKDRDGTPSYGGFQFKPQTFVYYATMYDIPLPWDSCVENGKSQCLAAATTTLDYATQRKILEAMVSDAKHIDWHQQFPDCVKKLGTPPAS